MTEAPEMFGGTSKLPPLPDSTRLSLDETLDWIAEARARCVTPGQYLAFLDGDEIVVHELSREWTRVGRSLAADVRFDDPTVSRRHALIVRHADGVRVQDDRSLNGVFVNGQRVEWSKLDDGDEVMVGRHELRFLDHASVGERPLAETSMAP